MTPRPVRAIDTGLRGARANVAFDQALIEARAAGRIPDTIRFLRFTPSALVGLHQFLSHEVRLEYCRYLFPDIHGPQRLQEGFDFSRMVCIVIDKDTAVSLIDKLKAALYSFKRFQGRLDIRIFHVKVFRYNCCCQGIFHIMKTRDTQFYFVNPPLRANHVEDKNSVPRCQMICMILPAFQGIGFQRCR